MKRKGYLYENIYNIDNIFNAYNEVCRNTKNRKKVEYFKEYRCTYVSRIHNTLKSESYIPGPYNVFTIYEPKERRIVSQGMIDKVINHLISRYILYPAVLPCLLDYNVASRKNMGTHKALEFLKQYQNYFSSKYSTYYVLKCDISKFFANIDHDILKVKLKKKIKDKKALKIVFDVIDSDACGLSIGNMTSQVLAIFYLNDMDHFIKNILNIKGYIRYQDDFLLFHESKQYLKYCLEQIASFLEKEKLTLNKKTRIYKNTDNFIFLGRNKLGKYSKYRTVKRRFKYKKHLYNINKIGLNNLLSSKICYKCITKK